jgi:3-methyladenine DNA glycosylase AlkD
MMGSDRVDIPSPDRLAAELVAALRAEGSPANVAGMARYGISTGRAVGVPVPRIRAVGKELRRACRDPSLRHAIAGHLWRSGVHEARILATLVGEPALVTAAQAERWIREVDSWDVCDQLCNNLLRDSPGVRTLAAAWPRRRAEFTRRAGLVLLAVRAVHDREATDAELAACLAACEAAADDPRNLVKKAVSWALRQVGKRSEPLRRAALAAAERIRERGSPQARWIAGDVRRELTHPRTVERMARKGPPRRAR